MNQHPLISPWDAQEAYLGPGYMRTREPVILFTKCKHSLTVKTTLVSIRVSTTVQSLL